MDNKPWLWRKRSSAKTIVEANKFTISAKGIDEESQKLQAGNELAPIRAVRNLNEKLASVLLDSQPKDDIAAQHEPLVQEATAGEERTEAEVVSLRKELDEALRNELAANERLTQSEATLKQCMQQLSSFQEEEQKKIGDAVAKATSKFEKAQKHLEDQLIETSKRLASLAIENTNLSKSLLVKDKLVEELQKHSSQTVAEFNALMARLDFTEKENAFLKYEFHMLEKELEVRNEELEYNRQCIEVSQRQHLDSVKKIAKLEAECQRLRILMRKKLPGPATFAKMKSEVDILSRKPNPVRDLIPRDTPKDRSPEVSVKNLNLVIEQLRGMEEENRILKETITKKNAELQSSRIMFSRTASRLSHVEAQVIELSGGQKSLELAASTPAVNEPSPRPGSDVSSDDGLSSSGSWATALISELEHFRVKSRTEHKAIDLSDMSLMDDFAEMEKLAVVSTQTSSREWNHHLSAGKELVALKEGYFGSSGKTQDIHSKDAAADESFDWLQEVLKALSRQQRISKRNLSELLEDIKIALGYVNQPSTKVSNIGTSVKGMSKQSGQCGLSKSIDKIIELIKGIDLANIATNHTADDGSKRDKSMTTADYYVHVFQWRSSELRVVLQRFVHTCNCLLNGNVGVESFAEELSFTLQWIMSNHVSLKDATSTRDKIKKHFGWNESRNGNEAGVALDWLLVESDVTRMSEEQSSSLQPATRNLQEENEKLKDDLKNMESERKDVEVRLQSAKDQTEALMTQLRESEQSIKCLQGEIQTLKESKIMIEDQMENQKSINEDLDTQLTVAKAKLNEVLQKFASLEVELEDKNDCYEELESTCLELQLQLESVAKMEKLDCGINEEVRQRQNGWEITSASVKLAECQETILNLGKQLKALASPREAALFDKVFNATRATAVTSNRNFYRRFSLRDQMLAEDNAKAIILRSPTEDAEKPSLNHSDNGNALCLPSVPVGDSEANPTQKSKAGNRADSRALAVVPCKKPGGFGLLRRFLMRRKKGGCKKSLTSVKI